MICSQFYVFLCYHLKNSQIYEINREMLRKYFVFHYDFLFFVAVGLKSCQNGTKIFAGYTFR